MTQILHSKILGEGKPLLILHGFLGMLDNWKSLGTLYAESGFQVHLIDQRNHGKSFHSEVFNYEVMVADLKNYLYHYQIENCCLMGHSMGGKTAMFFAINHPQYLEKLIVADIGPKYYAQHHQDILAGLTSINFEKIKTRNKADEQLALYVTDEGTRQFLLKNLYWKTPDQLAFRFNLESLAKNDIYIGEALPEGSVFENETLFVKGEKSDYIKPSQEALIATHFPKSVIKTVANAGHWLHAENPRTYFEVTNEFLAAK